MRVSVCVFVCESMCMHACACVLVLVCVRESVCDRRYVAKLHARACVCVFMCEYMWDQRLRA